MLRRTEAPQPTGDMVGWDRGADRASNDADVSSILPIIPYGGFSPVRLEGWHIRRVLSGSELGQYHQAGPSRSVNQLKPAPGMR
jgi:hypothetical protein